MAVWRANSAGDTSLLKGDTSPAAVRRGFSVVFEQNPFRPVAAVYDRRNPSRYGRPAVGDRRYNPLSDPGGGHA